MEDNANSIYQPLDEKKNEIRLIRLKSGQIEPQFEIAAFSLKDDPDYQALSYCWGDEPACDEILVNGTSFEVRPNLFDYLQSMVDEEHQDWIFIDAICINQDDEAEKIHQIGLMGEVYSKARLVVAWLGKVEMKPSARRMLCELLDGNITLDPFVEESLQHPSDDPGIDDPQREDRSFSAGLVFWMFIQPKYWTRLWIVQELLLAQNLEIRVGEFRISPQSLFQLFDGLYPIEDDWRRPAVGPLSSGNNSLYSARRILQYRVRMQTKSSGIPRLGLHDAIFMFGHQDCLKPCDKVFGLLGISSSHIQPSNTMSLVELYLRALNEALYVGQADDENEDNEIEERRTATNNNDHCSDEAIEHERMEAKLFHIALSYRILRTALALSWSNPIIKLVTDETFRLWSLQSNTAHVSFETHTTFLLSGLTSVSFKRVLSLCGAELQVKWWKHRNNVVSFSGNESDAGSYNDWKQLASRIYHDVHAKLDADDSVPKEFRDWLQKYLDGYSSWVEVSFKGAVTETLRSVHRSLSRRLRKKTK